MTLEDNWFEHPKVEEFMDVLEMLGFECDLVLIAGKPTLKIWSPCPEKLKVEP